MNEETKEKEYHITPPLGSMVTPSEVMTEDEVREFAVQLIMDPAQLEVWKEKLLKDPLGDVISWLEKADYKVTEIK